MAQLQKQKKKANKKSSTATETVKEDELKGTEPTEDATAGETSTDIPAEEKLQEEEGITGPDQPQEVEPQSDAAQNEESALESATEPMPPAPTSPDLETEPEPARTRAGHGRQPSLSIQSKMRSSSFRKTSVSQGSVSPSSTLKSPPQSLPPLTGDGESVHGVFQKQSTRIAELEKENKRLEKELADATARWRKTEEQVEDLREASVDGDALREQLKQAEEKVASIESLVSCTVELGVCLATDILIEGGNCCATAAELPASIAVTS